MSTRTEVKQLAAWVFLFGAMPFLSFHTFIFATYYYPDALEIPFLLVLPFVWLCCLRAMSYFPVTSAVAARMCRTPFARGNAFSLSAMVEAVIWYVLIAAGYGMLHRYFGFPKSADGLGVLSTLGYYLAFSVGSLLGLVLILLISRGLVGVLRELAAMRLLIHRLTSTFLLYLAVMLLFAGAYRLLSLHTSAAFNKPLCSTLDAIYFSTVTIATLGYGDITPISPMARVFAIAEALAGVFLLAVLIGFVISISLEERNSHNRLAGDGPK